MSQLVRLPCPFAKHSSVVTFEKNVPPALETAGNQRLSRTVEWKAADEEQHFRHGAESAAGWLIGETRRDQCAIEGSQPPLIREIRLLLAIDPRQHVEVSTEPSLAPPEYS